MELRAEIFIHNRVELAILISSPAAVYVAMDFSAKGLNVVTKKCEKSRRIVLFGSNFSDKYVFGYRASNADVKNTVPVAECMVGAICENF